MITTRLPRPADLQASAREQTEARARGALDRAVASLLSWQCPDGSWEEQPQGDLTTVVLDMLARDMLGILAPGHAALAARLIRSRQRPDGSWAQSTTGSPDQAATTSCYLALRLAGDPADAYHMALAAGWLREAGGLRCADLVTVLWLCRAGLGPWPYPLVAPAEVLLLPVWVTRRLPGDRCRKSLRSVPLAVIGSPRPTRRRPAFDLNEIAPVTGGRWAIPPPAGRQGPIDRAIDRAIGCWHRLAPLVPLLRAVPRSGERRGARWMLARQDPDGSWGQAADATALCLIALRQLGYGAGHRAVTRGLDWLDQQAGRAWTRPGGAERDLAAVADCTALAVGALAAAGLPAGHPALTRAAAFLARHQCPRRASAPRTWLRAGVPDRSVNWSSGSARPLAAVVAETVVADTVVAETVVAEAVAELSAAGLSASPQARRRVVWLLRAQSADGSWPGGGAGGDTIVTADVIRALIAAGVRPWKKPVQQAARWLADRQLPGRDASGGGWAAVSGHAPVPTVRATMAVVTALLACGDAGSLAKAEQGVEWLVRAQDSGHSAPYLSKMCDIVEALSAYLRLTAYSAAAGRECGSPT